MAVHTVSQVTSYLKDSLERDTLLADLWVSGEVSNATQSGAGHWYFTLKDSSAQLRCVMFRHGGGGQFLANGASVIVHGRVSFYEVRGELQLYADLVQLEGVGERYLELERLKLKLQQEGLFEPSRKRPIPPFPRHIGVATSPLSAVWHDIQTVIARRYPLVELVLAPCQVQGENAAGTIVEALQALNTQNDLDVVILARGGGSVEELWPFNEEAVARAIYTSRAPLISAVGHETDFTIADMVADVRAPTPSAAAELAVPSARELQSQVLGHLRSLYDASLARVEDQRSNTDRLVQRLNRAVPDLGTRRQRIDDLLHLASLRLEGFQAVRQERLRGLRLRLQSLDPQAVLGRGYASVQRGDTGEIVTKVNQVATDDIVAVHVSDGSFSARVTKRSPAMLQ